MKMFYTIQRLKLKQQTCKNTIKLEEGEIQKRVMQEKQKNV